MTNMPKAVADLLSDDDIQALKAAYNELNRSFHFCRAGGNEEAAELAEKHMETIGRLLDIS